MTTSRHDELLRPGRAARPFSRRELLFTLARTAGAAAAAPSLASLIARHALAQSADPAARDGAAAKRLVLLWLEGGPSHIDTFDPKPGAPTGGKFAAIPTGIDGWLMSEHLPGLAQRAQHLAVVRSMTSKEGNHSRARMLVRTGHPPVPTATLASIGSIVSQELGDPGHDLPPFVQVLGPPATGGHLGIEAAPFLVGDPTAQIENLSYAPRVDAARLDQREGFRAILDRSLERRGGELAVAENATQRQRARRLMDTPLLAAFDLAKESDATRAAYGDSKFGQGVLLARRLLDHGVTAVEVVLDGWDTHADNFNRTEALCKQLDPAYSALIDDLHARGDLARTLVVCMGEFGRTPDVGAGDGRQHWPQNWCVALAGGGTKPGTALGRTDELGKEIVDRPIQVADLFATFAQLLGLERDKELHVGKRPVKLIDPNGRVVGDLIA
jgi:hypothetical protein